MSGRNLLTRDEWRTVHQTLTTLSHLLGNMPPRMREAISRMDCEAEPLGFSQHDLDLVFGALSGLLYSETLMPEPPLMDAATRRVLERAHGVMRGMVSDRALGADEYARGVVTQ